MPIKNHTLKFFSVCLCGILSVAEASADEGQIPAPFGFSWSDTYSDVDSRFPRNVPQNINGLLAVYLGSDVQTAFDASLPSNTESVFLYFNEDDVLVKIQWNSEEFINDSDGATGKKEYSRILDRLSARLGDPDSELTAAGLRVYREKNEFYECLSYPDCGMWYASWGGEGFGGYASLRLHGKGTARGILRYLVEHELMHVHQEKLDSENAEKF